MQKRLVNCGRDGEAASWSSQMRANAPGRYNPNGTRILLASGVARMVAGRGVPLPTHILSTSAWSRMTPSRSFICRPRAKCHPGADDAARLATYRQWCPKRRPKTGRRPRSSPCPGRSACSARLDQHAQVPPLRCQPHRRRRFGGQGGDRRRDGSHSAVAAHLSTFAGLIVPLRSVIGPWRCG